jgi:hypothetical protein
MSVSDEKGELKRTEAERVKLEEREMLEERVKLEERLRRGRVNPNSIKTKQYEGVRTCLLPALPWRQDSWQALRSQSPRSRVQDRDELSAVRDVLVLFGENESSKNKKCAHRRPDPHATHR